MGRPHLKMRLPLAFVAVLGLATPLPRQALAANANITVAPDCSLQSLPDGTVNGSLFVKENGDLCTTASVTVGTVTVSNAFNLEATQLLVKADLDALAAAISSSIPAGTALIGGTTAYTSQSGADAKVTGCDTHALYDASDNGKKTVVAGVSAKKIYICGYILGTGGTATNLSLTSGTGSDCVTTSTPITPAYQLVANDRVGANSAFYNGLKTLANADNLCVNASAGNAHQVEVWYTIQ